jgi:hypothetical protein
MSRVFLANISRGVRAAWSRERLRAALILAAALHLSFFSCLWGDKTLLQSARSAASILGRGAWAGNSKPPSFDQVEDPGACAWQSEPWNVLIGYQYFNEHALPLWNPYQAYGVPLAANMQSQPYYPLTVVLAFHPTPRTYNWVILLRLFIAGFCAYLYLRLFLSFYPSLAGGIACLLAGHYILFLTNPELSASVLLPALLVSGEYLMRRRTYPTIAFMAAVILLIFLGGAPETALLMFAFSYLYFAFRISSDPQLRSVWLPIVKYLVFATVLGAALSMFMVLPFVAYIPQAWNNHEPAQTGGVFRGLGHDKTIAAAFTYVFPLLFGSANTVLGSDTASCLRNYFGIVCFFLSSIAVGCMLTRRWKNDHLCVLTWFFSVTAVFVFLKRFGLLVNFVGWLPGFRMLDFPKYQELLLSVSVSVLAAIGLERLITRSASIRVQCLALLLSFALFPWSVLRSARYIRHAVFINHIDPALPVQALLFPLCLLACMSAWLIWMNRGSLRFVSAKTGFIFVALVATELSGDYIYPVYHQFNKFAESSSDPYLGAPYLQFLKRRCGVDCRVVGQNSILAPSWAAAFQIFDVRDMDALYPRKYFPFLQNFFPDWRSHVPELDSCFRGFGNFDFANPVTRRFLQLSSIRYILGDHVGAFIPVYDREVKISEYDDVLPRAVLFYHVDLARNDAGVLQHLADPATDILQTAVVNKSELNLQQLGMLAAMNRAQPARSDAARIVSFKSRAVDVEAAPTRPALLMLNDTAFPGWYVEVDGRRRDWITTDYLFRGVLLDTGAHRVRFFYDPVSFRVGSGISVAAFLVLVWFGVTRYRHSRQERTATDVLYSG